MAMFLTSLMNFDLLVSVSLFDGDAQKRGTTKGESDLPGDDLHITCLVLSFVERGVGPKPLDKLLT